MGFEVDLTEDNPDTLNAGGTVVAGWHMGAVDDAYEDDEKGDYVFRVKNKIGINKGATLTYRVYDPDQGEDEGKQKWRAQHAKTMLKRLGCINDADCGKVVSIVPANSIGREMIYKVGHEEYKGKTSAKIAPYDLYERDNPGVPPEVRAAFGLPELPEHAKEREMREAKEKEKNGGKRGGGRSGKSSSAGAGAGSGAMAGAGAGAAAGSTLDVSDL